MQFSGFGGQGIVLSAVVFGTAAVRAGFEAVQTQSYGSEARGGECQAELLICGDTINSPSADQAGLLVALSQPALEKYLPRLRPGGTLVIDPELVQPPQRSDITILEVPVTRIASEDVGDKICANMVLLGFLQAATGVFGFGELLSAIRECVPHRFVELNVRAAEQGRASAKGVSVEI